MSGYVVVIVGGGLMGLMFVVELVLVGIDVVIVECCVNQDVVGVCVLGLYVCFVEVFDQCGVVEWFVLQGKIYLVVYFGESLLDISDFFIWYNYVFGLWQYYIECILVEWVSEFGVLFYCVWDVIGFL